MFSCITLRLYYWSPLNRKPNSRFNLELFFFSYKKANTFGKSLLLPLQRETCSCLDIIQLHSRYKNFYLDHTDNSINSVNILSWLTSSRFLYLVLRLWTLLFSYCHLMGFDHVFRHVEIKFSEIYSASRIMLEYGFTTFLRKVYT